MMTYEEAAADAMTMPNREVEEILPPDPQVEPDHEDFDPEAWDEFEDHARDEIMRFQAGDYPDRQPFRTDWTTRDFRDPNYCEHGMSRDLCDGPAHYPLDRDEMFQSLAWL